MCPYRIIETVKEQHATSERGDTEMTEFELKTNKAVYYLGEKLLNERLADVTKDEIDEAIEELTWCGYYNDLGGSRFGTLSVEEAYFLTVEHIGYNEANELLRDYGFIEAVA